MFRALRGRLGSCELKEVFRLRAHRASSERTARRALSRVVGTAGHARSTQYTPRVRGCQPPVRLLNPEPDVTRKRADDYKQRARRRQPRGRKKDRTSSDGDAKPLITNDFDDAMFSDLQHV